MIKNTPLTNIHRELGARVVEFAGYNMPLEYTGIINEHMAVRNTAGLFDVSHMGEFWVKGKEALPLLQRITTNDVSTMSNGDAQYNCFPNGNGGIVDDLIIYRFGAEEYMLVVNAANIEKDWKWINSLNQFGAELKNVSDEWAMIALQGPQSETILQSITTSDLSKIRNFQFLIGKVSDCNNVVISATGYTGAGGYELYCKNTDAAQIWTKLLEVGKPNGLIPAGLAARDTLRLEMGYSLYGNDIDDTTSPIEAGLGWIVKFSKHKEFVDKDRLLAQKTNGVQKQMVAFVMIDRGIPRKDYILVNKELQEIGRVTSGTMSPVLQLGIGMGYIKTSEAEIGNEIFVQVRNKELKAKIVKLPFIK